jgi:DNA-binding transcriptional MocR family regulator
MIRLKQAADLHSNRLSQWLVVQQLKSPNHYQRMDNLVQYYRAKRDQFADLLQMYFSEIASWSTPKGGLFFWLKLNQ